MPRDRRRANYILYVPAASQGVVFHYWLYCVACRDLNVSNINVCHRLAIWTDQFSTNGVRSSIWMCINIVPKFELHPYCELSFQTSLLYLRGPGKYFQVLAKTWWILRTGGRHSSKVPVPGIGWTVRCVEYRLMLLVVLGGSLNKEHYVLFSVSL